MKKRKELIRQIKDFVGTNRTGDAIKLLADEQLSDLDKELVMLNSRFSKLSEESRVGIIDADSAQIQLNKINFDLLALTELIEEQAVAAESNKPVKNEVSPNVPGKNVRQSDAESNSSTKYLLIGAGVLLAAVLGIWSIMRSPGESKDVKSPVVQETPKTVVPDVDPQIALDSIKKELDRKETARKDSLNRLKKIFVGADFEGGTIVYLDTIARRGLIMANLDAQVGEIYWREDLSLEKAGATGKRLFDGEKNTLKIVREFGEGKYPAKICIDYESEGFFDWYLPSEKELDVLYDYSKTHEGFRDKYYWSSTEYAGDQDVYYRSFYNGSRFKSIPLNRRNFKRQNKARVRPVRSFYFDK